MKQIRVVNPKFELVDRQTIILSNISDVQTKFELETSGMNSEQVEILYIQGDSEISIKGSIVEYQENQYGIAKIVILRPVV